MFRKLLAALFGLAMMGMAGSANATLITYVYEGTYDFGPGTIQGTFSYDDSVLDSNLINLSVGDYNEAGTITGEISGGPQDGAVFNLDLLFVRVLDTTIDAFLIYPLSDSNTFLQLFDSTATVFSDDSLPLSLNFSDFDLTRLFLVGTTIGHPTSTFQERYTITSFSQIPEPSTIGLFAIGLVGLGVMTRRRRKQGEAA